MKHLKGLLLGAVAASVFAAGTMVTPANADGSAVFGHKKGSFYFKSKDGNYSVLPGFKFQFDAAKNDTDNTFVATASTTQYQVRRLLLGLKGRAGSPNLTYGITLNLEGTIFDAYAAYKFIPELQVVAGNYKSIGIPMGARLSSSAGWMVDDPNQLGQLLGDRTNGFGVRGALAKTLKYEVKIHGGQGSNGSVGTEGFAYDVGLNWEPFGNYGSFNQPDYGASSKMRVNLSGGYQYMNNVTGNKNFATYVTNSNDTTGLANGYHVAAGVKMSGWQLGVMFEHANYQTNNKDINPGQRTYTTGVGASYMLVPNKIPLSASYFMNDPDSENSTTGSPGSVDNSAGIQRQVGVGAAYLFNGHQNKLMASWDRIAVATTATAISGSETNNNTHAFKLRWQLLF